MYFLDFTDVIQKLIPKFNLLNVDLKNQIKVADSISINIYINKTESQPQTSTTIITTHSRSPNPEEAEPKKSIELPPPEQSSEQLEPEVRDFPFSSGIHLRVNQSSWWNSQRHICIGQLQVIPLLVEQSVSFQGIGRPHEQFQACLHSDERLTVVNLEGREEETIINLSKPFNDNEHSLRGKSSDWRFEKYSNKQVIKFDMLPEIVLSLSETVAEKAIVMKREHDIMPVEYYVLVLRSSKTKVNHQDISRKNWQPGISALSAAGDLVGCVEGPEDLSTNPEYMQGFGE